MSWHLIKRGPVNFIFRHVILGELANQLSAGLAVFPKKRVNVLVGTHLGFPPLPKADINIAIQTEHFYDKSGLALWNRPSYFRTLYSLCAFDLLIDLSVYNGVHYSKIPEKFRKKIIFGPYIFPDFDPNFLPAGGDHLIFFGGISERRKLILSELSRWNVEIVANGVFGPELLNLIHGSSGVLNIHYGEGVFTEFPRLLTAYLAGKPVISERLGALVAGRHYFDLSSPLNSKDEARQIFHNFKVEVAGNFRFGDVLRSV